MKLRTPLVFEGRVSEGNGIEAEELATDRPDRLTNSRQSL